jgi:hypothetical protein
VSGSGHAFSFPACYYEANFPRAESVRLEIGMHFRREEILLSGERRMKSAEEEINNVNKRENEMRAHALSL